MASQKEMTHTQEYEKTYDDIFGSDDDDDDGPTPSASKASKGSSGGAEDDIFGVSDDDDDEAPSSGRLSKLSRGSDKKKKPKKDKEKKKGKKSKRDFDEDEDVTTERRKKRKSSIEKDAAVTQKGNASSSSDTKVDSGDEYDSEPEVVRTAEDDAFIDVNDDDDDLVKDYSGQDQKFVDDKPIHRNKDKYTSDSMHERESSGKGKKDAYSKTLETMKRRRGIALTDPQKEKATEIIIQKMIRAQQQDEQAVQTGMPALAKLSLLPDVENTVGIKTLQHTLLERNILDVFKTWIEPRSDKTLPSLNLRSSMYKILLSLPCQIDHLRRCKIGQTVVALRAHKQETKLNKRTLKEIIEKWSRPIFSNDGESAPQDNQTMIQDAILNKSKMKQQELVATGDGTVRKQFDLTQAKSSDQGASRVRVPFGEGFMFTAQPDSKVDKNSAREISIGQVKGDLMKQMKNNKKTYRKSQDGGRLQSVELSGRNKK